MMTVTSELHAGVAVLKLNGTFVGKENVTLFEQAVFEQLKQDVTKIVLDLSELKHIDSAGLGSMISAMVSVGRTDGSLKLAAVRGDAARIMTSMHLDSVFTVYETVEKARGSF